MAATRKTITITLYMSELIYDVQNKTYLTGRSRLNGQNHEEVAHMQANDDDENANQIARSIGNAFFNLKTQLAEYVDAPGTTADDILISTDTNLTMALLMPSNYNEGTRESLAVALHQYLVNSAVGEWFTITNKADAAEYIQMAAANLGTMRDAAHRRTRPVRPEVETVDSQG